MRAYNLTMRIERKNGTPEKSSRGSMVVVSHVVPRSHTGNAGQNYQSAQVAVWQEDWDVTCVLRWGRSSELEQSESTVPLIPLAVSKGRSMRSLARRFLGFVARRYFPGLPDLSFRTEIEQNKEAVDALRGADVIVLQWQEFAMHAAFFRKLNPRAQIVGVLHDVVSQSLSRKAARSTSIKNRLKFAVAQRAARGFEKKVVCSCDSLIVLSLKDRMLLPQGSAEVHVVPPAITVPWNVERSPIRGRVMMVAGWREEDITGVHWFAREVLPRVQAAAVSIDVHLVGKMRPEVAEEMSELGFTPRGFVDDLSAEYASAAVAIVPLQLGAGVKFKTVEAILHRVPVVATTVGAEGVTGFEGTSEVSVNAEEFARRLRRFLTDATRAQENANRLHAEVEQWHGLAAFRDAAHRVPRAVGRS